MRAAANDGDGSGSVEPQTCRHEAARADRARGVGVLGGTGPARCECLPLSWILESAGHRQGMPDDEYGHVSGGNAVSGVYASVVPWGRGHQLSGRANFSALAHLIGDLRSRMLASEVERTMFIRLNRHLIDEVRGLDAPVAQARARVAKTTQLSVSPQEERSHMAVDLTVYIPRRVMWIVSLVCLPLFTFSFFFFTIFCCCFKLY